jgi:hypothetical protein
MLPDDEAALQHAQRLSEVTKALSELTGHDCLNSACGLVAMASVLVHAKPAESTALALHLIKIARELDPHTASVQWQ